MNSIFPDCPKGHENTALVREGDSMEGRPTVFFCETCDKQFVRGPDGDSFQ